MGSMSYNTIMFILSFLTVLVSGSGQVTLQTLLDVINSRFMSLASKIDQLETANYHIDHFSSFGPVKVANNGKIVKTNENHKHYNTTANSTLNFQGNVDSAC